MRLIDVDELLKTFTVNSDGRRIPEKDCDNFDITISLKEIKRIIREQPTAYDVDKVVEQLKLTSKTALDLAIKRIPGFRFMAPGFQALIDECFEEAVEIVKAGGNIELSEHSKSQGN